MSWTVALQIGIIGGNYIYQRWLKNRDQEAPERDAFRLPRVRENAPIPLVYGTVRVNSPQLIFAGAYDAEPIEQGGTIVSYSYKAALQFAIGIPMGATGSASVPFTELRSVWIDDVLYRPQFGASLREPPDEFVFNIRRGEIRGDYDLNITYQPGTFTQTKETSLNQNFIDESGLDETLLPPYRGIAQLIFRSTLADATPNSVWGRDGSVPSIGAEIYAITAPLSKGAITDQNATSLSGWADGHDANPAEVVYDILANAFGRCGLDESLLDSTSFGAAADTLASENHGISMVIDRGQEALSYLEAIMGQVAGVLYQDFSDGLIKLTLFRDDYTVGLLDSYGPAEIDSVRWKAASWKDTYNTVHLTYTSRTRQYADATITDQDDAHVEEFGVREQSIRYPHVKDDTLAFSILARDLKVASTPIGSGTIVMSREATDVNPGDVFKLNWPEHHLSNVVCRVLRKHPGTLADGRIRLEVMEDVWAAEQADIDDGWQDPPLAPPPASIEERKIIEMPRGIARTLYADELRPRLVALAERPSGFSEWFDMEVEENDDGSFDTDRESMSFAVRFTVATEYSRLDEPYDTITGLDIENVTSISGIPTSLTENDIRQNGTGLVIVGDELMHYRSITDNGGGSYTLNNVWRGAMDTVPVEHEVGTEGWFIFAADHSGEATYGTTDDLDVRLPTSSLWSQERPEDARITEITMANRPPRPYPADDLKIEGSKAAQIWQQWQDWAWLRRRNDLDSYYRPDDADDRHPAVANHSAVTYDAEAKLIGDGAYAPSGEAWSELAAAIDDNAEAVSYGPLNHGDHDFRLVSKRDFLGVIEQSSWQSPTLRLHLARYRQLLRNPSFEDDLTGWTTVSGSPSVAASGGLDNGKYLTGSGASWTVRQDVDISAWSPLGLRAQLRSYIQEDDSDDRIRIRLQALDSGDSVLDESDSTAKDPSSGQWDADDRDLTIPADTVTLRVQIEATTGATSADAMIDGLDLRLGQITDELLSNPGFNTNLADWTTVDGTWARRTSDRLEGGGCLRCTSTETGPETREIYSEATIPTGFKERGTVHLSWWTDMLSSSSDYGQVILETRTSGGSVLDSVASGQLSPSDWTRTEMFLELEDTADTLRVRVISHNATGETYDAIFDAFRLHVHKELHPVEESVLMTFDNTPAQDFPEHGSIWEDDYSTPRPDAIYRFTDTAWPIESDIDSSTPFAYFLTEVGSSVALLDQTCAGFRQSSDDSYAWKSALETVVGSRNGAQMRSATTFSMDGSTDWTTLIAFRVLDPTASDPVLMGSDNGSAGWSLYVNSSTGDLQLLVRGASGTVTTTLNAETYNVGALHYVTIRYKGGSDEVRIWTEAEDSGNVDVSSTGDASNVGAVCLGCDNNANSGDAQFAYRVDWRDSADIAKTDTDSWWQHGTDPTGELTSYDSVVPVAGRVDSGANGEIVSMYSGQVAIFESDDLTTHGRGLADQGSYTPLVDPDPIAAEWTAHNGLSVTDRAATDAMLMTRAVELTGDNTQWLKSVAITKGAGDIVLVVPVWGDEDSGSLRVLITDSADNVIDSHSVTYSSIDADDDGKGWTLVRTVLSWDGSTADLHVGISPSDSGTSRNMRVSMPIFVSHDSAGEGAAPAVIPLADMGSMRPTIERNTALDARFNHEGEVRMIGIRDGVPSGLFLWDIQNGTNDNDRRVSTTSVTAGVHTMFATHYDGSGTSNDASCTLASPTSEWTARQRWARSGLMDDDTVHSEARADSNQGDGRTSAWTPSATPLDEASFGPVNGLISEIEISSRERPV